MLNTCYIEFKLNENVLIAYRRISTHCLEGVFTVLKAVALGMDSSFIGPPKWFR